MKKSMVILVLITLLVFLLAGCTSGESELAETTEVVRGDLVETVPISGNLEMPDRVNLSFGMTGEVLNVLVDRGDQVKKGDILASLDTAEIEARLMSNLDQQTRSDLEIQKATINVQLNSIKIKGNL